MKSVLIMRHGQAQALAASDAERELTKRGRQEVAQMAQALAVDLQSLEQCWVSPYRRARQTLDVVIETLALPMVPKVMADLTPDASVARLSEALEQSEGRHVLLVSHMPMVAELVEYLTGSEGGQYSFDTASVARVEADIFAAGLGELQWLRHREAG